MITYMFMTEKVSKSYKWVISWVELKTKCTFKFIQADNEQDMLDKISKTVNIGDKAVILSEFGIYAQMYLSKFKNIIPALVADETSAGLAIEHNHSDALIISLDMVGTKLLLYIIYSYITNEFAGGRHQIRINMLKKELEI